MFDIGFSEIFVIAVVALLVLGPERLPKAARFAGLWVRRARAQWYSVKSEFERELADEELKRSLLDVRDDLNDAGRRLHDSGASLKREFESIDPERRGARPPDPSDNLADAADRSRGSGDADVVVDDDDAPRAGGDGDDAGGRDASNSTSTTGDDDAPRA